MKLPFLDDFNKSLDKMDGVGREANPPTFWINTGSYVLNRLISGSFTRGIPQGRITSLSGPSASGKSFLLGNLCREAQKDDAFVLVVDSENALDTDYLEKIGVDCSPESFGYVSVGTIPQCQAVVSAFMKQYKKEYGSDPKAPKVLIAIDSLSMLSSESEVENYQKGVAKGDQGQRNKQLKSMLRAFTLDIKDCNVAMVNTVQVYKNQDVTNGEGLYIIPDAVKYAASQIVLVTKLKLRGEAGVEGIRMKCEGYKTRFTKPFQSATLEVPYDAGIDPFNGLLEAAVGIGVVQQRGAWYVFGDEKFQSKNFDDYAERILAACETQSQTMMTVDVKESELDTSEDSVTAKSKRMAKLASENDSE